MSHTSLDGEDSPGPRNGALLPSSRTRWHDAGQPSRTRNTGTRRFTGLAMGAAAAASLMACNSHATLEEEWQAELDASANQPLRLLDYFPEPGAPGVPKDIAPYFLFNRPVDAYDSLSFSLPTYNGTIKAFETIPDFDLTGIMFHPSGQLYPDGTETDFTMNLSLDDEALISPTGFTSTFPEGLIFNMSVDLKCDQFGGSFTQAKLLQAYFTPGVYPLWLMVPEGVTEKTTFPTTTNLFIGPAFIRSTGGYRIYRHIGFSTNFRNVTIQADGSFQAASAGEFLPLDSPNRVIPLWLTDLKLSGTFDLKSSPPRIQSFQLRGVLPTRSLLLLSNESENYATAVNGLALNIDSNGNGVNDSATFGVSSNPETIPMELWEP